MVLGDFDAGLAAEVLGVGIDVEHRDSVAGRGVALGRPDGILGRVGGRAGEDVRRGGRRGPVGPGEHLGLPLSVGGVEPVVVEVGVGAAAAQDEVNGALAGVEHPAVGGRNRMRPQGVDHGAGGHLVADVDVRAAHRERPLVVVVVPVEHQVDLVPVEQRQPLLADTQVRAISGGRGGTRALVHLHDDPVHRRIVAADRQRPLQPCGLRAARVAPDVERRAGLDRRVARARHRDQCRGAAHERARVLVDHVVGVEGDEQRRPDPEAVPASAETVHVVVRQRVAGQVGGEPLRSVVEFHLVVAQARHPGPAGGRSLVVVAEVAPHLGLHGGVEIRVAQVAVQQVEQRLEGLDRVDRVGALPVGEHPGGVRRGQVAEAGEAERLPAVRGGAEGGGERVRGVAVVVGGHRVRVGGAGTQPADPRVVGPHRLAVDPVGVLAGLGRDNPLPDPHPGPRRGIGRGPGNHDVGRGIFTPGQMDLLGRAVAARAAGLAGPGRGPGGGGRGREQARSASGEHLASRYGGPQWSWVI
jgi:hypothetical protein